MSEILTNRFDQYELLESLQRGGISDPAARVLVSLLIEGANDSQGLQENCGIRQPEVSIGIAELRELEIVEFKSVRRNGRGRPRHKYSLCGDLEETLEPILLRARMKLDNLAREISKLEKIVELYV